jgi:hypothetical protein
MTVRPLPMHIPLVARETLESYLTRLARANHLDLRDLRSHLGMRTPTRPPDLHRLATLTEHSLQRLTDVLADACPPPGRTRLSPLRGRPACRHCTLRRGIPTDALCVAVDQRVCQRHRRWLGGLTDPVGDQHDLTALPKVIVAQRRHHSLIRRHGAERGRAAISSAAAIIDSWNERGVLSEGRHHWTGTRLSAGSGWQDDLGADASRFAMVRYPDTVTLATLLADPHWSALASADRRADRLPFELEVARRLQLPCIGSADGDPLVSWEEGQALARRWRLHQQPGYRGPEVWLSTSA